MTSTQPFRLLLFIDHLGPGGAQRQISLLAKLLKAEGQDVAVLVYQDFDFFEADLVEAEVPLIKLPECSKFQRILGIRKRIKAYRPDAVIAYLGTPSFISELATLPLKRFKLIVSERTGKIGEASRNDFWRLKWHRLADAVVTNSNALKEFVIHTNPKLTQRTHVIFNGVDYQRFESIRNHHAQVGERFDIVVLARFSKEKNPFGLLDGLTSALSRINPDIPKPRVTWYGNNGFQNGEPTARSTLFLRLREEIKSREMTRDFVLQNHTREVMPIYRDANCICLPSFYEGCSNVLCEATVCGKPLLASDVCDNPILVNNGQNGYVFDPNNPQDIADAILKMCQSSQSELESMGRHSLKVADQHVSPKRFVNAYLDLIKRICN